VRHQSLELWSCAETAAPTRPYGGPTTGESAQIADSRQIRSSVGAGLIWGSPFGPLRVDDATPLTKAP